MGFLLGIEKSVYRPTTNMILDHNITFLSHIWGLIVILDLLLVLWHSRYPDFKEFNYFKIPLYFVPKFAFFSCLLLLCKFHFNSYIDSYTYLSRVFIWQGPFSIVFAFRELGGTELICKFGRILRRICCCYKENKTVAMFNADKLGTQKWKRELKPNLVQLWHTYYKHQEARKNNARSWL